MKRIAKKTLAALLSAVLLLSMTSWAAAADYEDMPSGWSKEAMEAAVENRLLQGDDLGRLNPLGLLTRSQMAAVVVRAFGASVQADLSDYQDMDSGKWYYEAVSQAAHMGIMAGDGQRMNPESNITRQEVFAILARALKLTNGDPTALERFSDADKVADWAVGDVAAMVSAGYVSGDNGRLNPASNITREEFAQVMFNTFGTYYTQAGTYTEAPARSVMVNVPDVTLKNITVPGDIIIGDGVGDGDVTLDHVNIEGRLVVRGGGVNSIHIIGGEQAWQVVIAKVDGNVRVVADEGTKIETITVEDGSDDIIIEGNVATVNVETEGVTVKLNNARVDKLNVVAANTAVTMSGKTAVTYLSVSEGAEGTKVEADKGVTISNVLADTDLTLEGNATIREIEGEGNVTDESGKEVKPSRPTGGGGGSYTPPPHSHTWTETRVEPGTNESGNPIHGILTKACSCGETVTETLHPWNEGEVTTPATCSADGVKTFTCRVEGCGETTTEAITDRPNHTPAEAVRENVVPATCAAEGSYDEVIKCSVCQTEISRTHKTTEKTNNHTEVVDPAVAATCGTAGKTEGKHCSVCNTVLVNQTEIPATGEHTPGEWEITKEATATELGTKVKRCTVCQAIVETETIPATGTGSLTFPEPTGFSFSDYNGGVAVTANFEDDFEGPEYYIDIYLSKDGGATWSPEVGEIHPGSDKGNTSIFEFSKLDTGTYTKLKLRSWTVSDRKLVEESKIFDCNVTVTVNSSNATATFSRMDEENYAFTITGLNVGENRMYMVWFSESSDFSGVFSGTGRNITDTVSNNVPASRFEGIGSVYYCIADYDKHTASGITASFTFNRTAWEEVTVTENP